MQIIDGKKIRDQILQTVKEEVAKLSFVPLFCDVLVGEDLASVQYVAMKARVAEEVGIKFYQANFEATITTEELVREIQALNNMPNMCGIIAQLPLPEHIDKRAVLDAIDSRLDVDCLGSKTSSEFYMGNSKIGFPTALACMAVLDSISLDLSSKNVLVMGQGDLVGKPVTALLKARGVVAHTITRSTEGKEELMKNADVIISGMGQGKYITGDMVKQGAVIVDAGTSEENSAIVGDVDFESVSKVASHISPVPGGVGPVTVAMLLKNVLTVAKNR